MDLEINYLKKKPMSYIKFVVLTSFFGNSIARKNFYFSGHLYNPARYQMASADWAGLSATQNFYSIRKQNNVMLPISQNFNNRKNCSLTCRYKYFYTTCVGFYPVKDCLSNIVALESNLIPFRHQ